MATPEEYASWIVANADKKGTPDFETVAAAYQASKAGDPAPTTVPQLSRTDKYLQGVRDPIDAGAQMLVHALPAGVVSVGNRVNNWIADNTGLVGKLPEGGVDQQIADREKTYQAGRSAGGESGFDSYRALGNVVNPTNIALGYGAGIAAPASFLGRVGVGAATGAIGGTLTPVTDGDFVDEKTKQLGIGAGIGAALPFVGSALGRVISPEVSESVKTLIKNKVTPSMGQILGGGFQKFEDKLTSVPLLGDAINYARGKSIDELNRAAYAKALAPIGGQVPADVGRDAIASVRNQISEKYDSLLPKLTFKSDPQFVQDLQQLRTMAQNLAPQEARKFETLLNEHLSKMSPSGGMAGETFKITEGALNKEAKRFSSSMDPYQQELGDALNQTLQTFRSGLSRSNPDYAKELGDINKSYANYVRLRDAASRQGSQDGKITPAQLAAAIRNQDKTVGKGAYSEGTALMQDLSDSGKKSLASQYPDSGTAGRLLASLLTGGAAAGAATVSPLTVGAAGLTAIPYLPGGRQAMAALLARRPDIANPIAEAVRKYSPALTSGVLPAIGNE